MRTQFKNIARVEKAHGMKGEAVVVALRGLPFLLEEGMRVSLTPPALHRERVSTVEHVSEGADGVSGLVRFSCAHNLDEASGLAGCYVLARTDDLDLDPLTASVDDLVGAPVEDDRLGVVGEITEVICGPANDAWVIEGAYGEVIIPVIPDVVLEIPEDGPIPVHLPGGVLPDEVFAAAPAAAATDAAGDAANVPPTEEAPCA